MSEKTHEPSEQKRRKARESGDIARSKVLAGAGVTFFALLATVLSAPATTAALLNYTRRTLSPSPQSLETALLEGLLVLTKCSAPTLLGALFGCLATALPMTGMTFSFSFAQPKFQNLNPLQGAQRLFSRRQLLTFAQSLVLAAVMGALMWRAVQQAGPLLFKAISHDAVSAFRVLLALLWPALLKTSAILLVFGLGDYALARWQHTKDLMMTFEEVKQEHKNSEGDPHTKGQRKHLMKQLAQGGPARGVQTATTIVVNPTHIAVALRYDESECEAPYIVAKGREEVALSLRQTAKDLGIPVVRDVPLARALIHYDVGEAIPPELYQAAAAVLRVAFDSVQRENRGSEPTPNSQDPLQTSERRDAHRLNRETP